MECVILELCSKTSNLRNDLGTVFMKFNTPITIVLFEEQRLLHRAK